MTVSQWRPAPFSDAELDFAMRNIYDGHYKLQTTSLNTLVNGETIARGTTNVTGSLKDFATGLSKVTSVTVSLDSGTAGVAELVSATPSQKPGCISIYVLQTGGSPSVTKRAVHWQATGIQ